jgi:hypothetical protein
MILKPKVHRVMMCHFQNNSSNLLDTLKLQTLNSIWNHDEYIHTGIRPVGQADDWWLVLICSEKKVLLASSWWLICSEKKVSPLVADKPDEQYDNP